MCFIIRKIIICVSNIFDMHSFFPPAHIEEIETEISQLFFFGIKVFNILLCRDVIVVTSLDTITSLMAGFTIFGILGNLAHELGTDDITKVVRGGTGLAFISYPDAIAKFTVLPQVRTINNYFVLYFSCSFFTS